MWRVSGPSGGVNTNSPTVMGSSVIVVSVFVAAGFALSCSRSATLAASRTVAEIATLFKLLNVTSATPTTCRGKPLGVSTDTRFVGFLSSHAVMAASARVRSGVRRARLGRTSPFDMAHPQDTVGVPIESGERHALLKRECPAGAERLE